MNNNRDVLDTMTLPDLRVKCRAMGLSPAGGIETLRTRLKENQAAGGGGSGGAVGAAPGAHNGVVYSGTGSGKPSSRVLAPPGGGSSNIFGQGPTGPAPTQQYSDHRAMQSNVNFGGAQPMIGGPMTAQPQQQQQQMQQQAAGGSGSRSNMGGYGSYDINQPSSRVLAPPGGGSSNIFGAGPAPTPQQNQFAGHRGNASNISFGAPQQMQQQQMQGAGGSASQSNMGGYGTYDINKPSSRVLAPPGGGSSNIFGGPAPQAQMRQQPQQQQQQQQMRQQPQQQQQQQQMNQQRVAGGSSSQSNMGGYGTYDINKPSSRVLAPPGGGSSFSFG